MAVWYGHQYNLVILIFFIHYKVLLWYHSILTKLLESFDVKPKFYSTVAVALWKDDVLVLRYNSILFSSFLVVPWVLYVPGPRNSDNSILFPSFLVVPWVPLTR
jgi:hypothetical protein